MADGRAGRSFAPRKKSAKMIEYEGGEPYNEHDHNSNEEIVVAVQVGIDGQEEQADWEDDVHRRLYW
jgi:hypothetical protein